MKAQHTPGPWQVVTQTRHESGESWSAVQTARGVAFDVTSPGAVPDEEHAANVRLIAAAPELLACLRRMCGMYSAYSRRLAPLLAEDEGTVWSFERANGLALEAIAKAEGWTR